MNYSKGRKIYIIISAIILLGVMATIFILSAQNDTESSSTSSWVVELLTSIFGTVPNENTIRTIAHFCEFAGLGFVLCNFIFSLKNKILPILSILLSSGYALTDEIHQFFVPGRACQLIDWCVDTSGTILGVAVFCCIILIIKHKKPIDSD